MTVGEAKKKLCPFSMNNPKEKFHCWVERCLAWKQIEGKKANSDEEAGYCKLIENK